MKKSVSFFLIVIFFSFSNIFAQDEIRTKTDTIRAKVMEIGIDEIKYYDFSNLNGPLIVISKKDVIEIKYENGSRFLVSPDPYDISTGIVEARKKRHAIKFEFFSPLTNDIAFAFESMISVGKNAEFKVGIIGPGTRPNDDKASGVFLKGGLKFLTKPTYLVNGIKYAHGLHGPYIKPEVIFNTYTTSKLYTSSFFNGVSVQNISEQQNIRYTNVCFNIIFGKQHLLGNSIALDYYLGVGYGLQNSKPKSSNLLYFTENQEEYSYSHLFLGSDTPLIFSGGMTIGVLF